jgi:aryl-alcohol dehydrogenase-like predicted oxidoreductase
MAERETQRVCEPRRPLGRTGFVASALGIGDLADRAVPIERCVATARRALDAGLNVIDTAPNYEDGYSETIVGRAVREAFGGSRRDEVFVVSKIDHHDEPIEPQVSGSLQRTGLDHIDLFVFHGLSSLEGWSRATACGGGFDQLDACCRAGKARFRGISSHDPAVLLEALQSGLCDVVMFAVGPYVDMRYIEQVLPAAAARGVGTICFKAFGAGKLLADTEGYQRPLSRRPRGKLSSGGVDSGDDDGGGATLPRLTVEQCLHYTLTCDPDVALLGLSFPNEQDAALAAFKRFAERGPLSRDEMTTLRERAAEAIAGKGPCWWNPAARDADAATAGGGR